MGLASDYLGTKWPLVISHFTENKGMGHFLTILLLRAQSSNTIHLLSPLLSKMSHWTTQEI